MTLPERARPEIGDEGDRDPRWPILGAQADLAVEPGRELAVAPLSTPATTRSRRKPTHPAFRSEPGARAVAAFTWVESGGGRDVRGVNAFGVPVIKLLE